MVGPTTGTLRNVGLRALLAAVYTPPVSAQGRFVFSQSADWLIESLMLAFGLILLLCISYFLWSRERRLRRQRERLRNTYNLGEEILSASSPETILKRVSASLTAVIGVTGVRLYVYNRGSKTLDSVATENSDPASISLTSPPGGAEAGAVACFHYRTLLVIPDIDRSPFPMAPSSGERGPKSLLFVPLLTQGEVTGVLELSRGRAHEFTVDEQALVQHVANQIGVAFRLLDQRSVQELSLIHI